MAASSHDSMVTCCCVLSLCHSRLIHFRGACCLGMGFVQKFDELLVARLMLGLAEGGLFPGVTYYLTTWYPRSKIALRIAIFFSAATIAGAFGGLLAYALQNLDGKDHLKGWQWIFMFVLRTSEMCSLLTRDSVEGLITCIVAFGAYFVIPNTPAEAHWLSEHERNVMKEQIAHDGHNETPFDDTFKWKYVRQGVTDWKLWLNLIQYFASLMTLYSVSLSLPSIVKGLGYKSVGSAQLHTVPVYIVACFCVVAASYLADWSGRRSPVVLGCSLVAMSGWATMYLSSNMKVRYVGAFLAASGAYSSFPPVVAILTSNIGGKTKRATVIGLQVGLGGLSGCVSSNIFRAKDAPHYRFGLAIDLIFTAICFAATILNMVLLMWCNTRKEESIRSGKASSYSKEQLSEMGDDSPYFSYQW